MARALKCGHIAGQQEDGVAAVAELIQPREVIEEHHALKRPTGNEVEHRICRSARGLAHHAGRAVVPEHLRRMIGIDHLLPRGEEMRHHRREPLLGVAQPRFRFDGEYAHALGNARTIA